MKISEALTEINIEFNKASEEYPEFHSFHEGYSIILEELDEAWDEIKKKKQDPERIKHEIIQTGAMCIRFLVNLL